MVSLLDTNGAVANKTATPTNQSVLRAMLFSPREVVLYDSQICLNWPTVQLSISL
jgi:hypothetical protein